MKTAVLIGATGLIGSLVERQLWQTPGVTAVRALVRRPWAASDSRTEVLVVDFSKPETWQAFLQGDALFCCLGTTIKQAGSQEAFRAVDYQLPVTLARLAALNRVQRMVVMSSMGADVSSAIFYSRVKGEMERDIHQFAPLQATAVRPSLLLGDRAEARLGERVSAAAMRAFDFMIPLKYKAIAGTTVARAMIAIAQLPDIQPYYENDRLFELGEK